jgi:hypothetical protein
MSSSSFRTKLSRDTRNNVRTGKSTRNSDDSRRSGVTAPFISNLFSKWRLAVMIHVPVRLTPGMELWYVRLGGKLRVGDRKTVLRKPIRYLYCPSDAQILKFRKAHY